MEPWHMTRQDKLPLFVFQAIFYDCHHNRLLGIAAWERIKLSVPVLCRTAYNKILFCPCRKAKTVADAVQQKLISCFSALVFEQSYHNCKTNAS